MDDIRDIKGLVPLPMSKWWLWLLLAVVIAALLAWFIGWLRKRRQARAVPPALPRLSPYELAVRSLQQLIAEKLHERGLADEFYTKLSQIVRVYLEGRFALRAPELTTEEFLREVSRDDTLTQGHKDLLAAFLQESDLVKFAKLQPSSSDMRRALEAAENFIHETRPRLGEEATAGSGPSSRGTAPGTR